LRVDRNMIPKMDYVVATRDNIQHLEICLKAIKKQSNVNKVIVVADISGNADIPTSYPFNIIKYVRTGHFFAKVMGAKLATTDYIVCVDDDVELKDNWIEDMWPYLRDNNAIFGQVPINAYHEKRLRKFTRPMRTIENARLQNTILRRKLLYCFKYRPMCYGIDAGLYFGKFLAKIDKPMLLVPVFSPHVKLPTPRGLRDGLRGGAKGRRTGDLTWRGLLKYLILNTIGSIKCAFQYGSYWYFRHGVQMSIGLLIGFLKWSEYIRSLDY
jgi:glycosyltransferase involved in cell wall biosynthesis